MRRDTACPESNLRRSPPPAPARVPSIRTATAAGASRPAPSPLQGTQVHDPPPRSEDRQPSTESLVQPAHRPAGALGVGRQVAQRQADAGAVCELIAVWRRCCRERHAGRRPARRTNRSPAPDRIHGQRYRASSACRSSSVVLRAWAVNRSIRACSRWDDANMVQSMDRSAWATLSIRARTLSGFVVSTV